MKRGKYEYVLLSPVTVVHITEQMDVKSLKIIDVRFTSLYMNKSKGILPPKK